MKIRTVIISVVVSASLVAGIGYGAYYAMKGEAKPVEVVPVANVNSYYGYGGDEGQIYGSITSQVAQTVMLNEEYAIEKIYVEEGDTVEEGAPLFSYDMTLPELELEMAKLNLQSQELTMVRLEKDLEKLKNTKASASLDLHAAVRTASAEEPAEEIVEEAPADAGVPDGSDLSEAGETGSDASQAEASDAEESTEADPGAEGGSPEKGSSDEFVQSIESVEGADIGEDTDRIVTIRNSVQSYERLMAALDVLILTYGDSLEAADIRKAMREIVAYYRKNLADEQVTDAVGDDGEAVQERSYVIKDEVRQALDEEEFANLETYAGRMDQCHAAYVQLLIAELDPENPGDFAAYVKEAREEYESLVTAMRAEVANLDRLAEMEKRAEAGSGTAGAAELGTEPGTAAGAEFGTESGVDTASGDETESGTGETSSAQAESGLPGDGSGVTQAGESGLPGETSAGETEVFSETESPDELIELDAQGQETGETQTESASEESEQQTYTVTVKNGTLGDTADATGQFRAGDTVTIRAKAEDETQSFVSWLVTPNTVALADAAAAETTFVMPESSVEVEAVYDEKIKNSVESFLALAEAALGADGVTMTAYDPGALETAIAFYQANLADEAAEIVDGGTVQMEEYELKQSFADYLTANGREHEVTYLPERYKALCMTFVKTLVDSLNPQQLIREKDGDTQQQRYLTLDFARRSYDWLGDNWRAELDASVTQTESGGTESPAGDVVSYNGQTDSAETEAAPMPGDGLAEGSYDEGTQAGDGSSEEETQTGAEGGDQSAAMQPVVPAVLTYGERLAAYEVILEIQETENYMAQPTELLVAYLTQVRENYLALTDGQKSVVWNSEILIELLKQYGLWEEEPQTGNPFPNFDGGMDGFGDEGYTAEELRDMIDDKERDIRECELSIREANLAVDKQQRVVDGKVVKSTMEGTVVSIGTEDGNSENDYFVKVVNETGLFAKGVMNELTLERVKVGDTISGQTDDGMFFTAVVKEVSDYPDPDGSNYSMSGSENTNASYYPFYALLDDTEGISEGGATIQLSGDAMSDADAIYLENYFIRTGNDGRSYLYIQGKDGTLVKQYVTTGKSLWGYATEITSGLTKSDRIAFPYGEKVFEGAPTKEVDQLEEAYGGGLG